MERSHNDISIRSARREDAGLLCKWWNDGSVMAHAGFPNGLGTTVEEVQDQIEKESDETDMGLPPYTKGGGYSSDTIAGFAKVFISELSAQR